MLTRLTKKQFMIILNCKCFLLCFSDHLFMISHAGPPDTLPSCFILISSQFDPAPRDESWHKSPRTPDYFL